MMSSPRTMRAVACAVALVVLGACGSTTSPKGATRTSIANTEGSTSTTAAAGPSATLLAVGDIADCKVTEDSKTAEIVRQTNAPIAILGDLAYDNGTAKEFADCYNPPWGSFKDRSYPAAGNHEYNTKGAAPYYAYFGARAGKAGEGWYSYDVGAWHVIALNSNCASIGGCDADSPQVQWLRADLAAHKNTCVAAYWHHPRWSSGLHGPNTFMDAIWRTLADAKVDIALSGHDHDYERFAPKDASGATSAQGLRQFVIGTGGRYLTPAPFAAPGSELRNDQTWGVLELTLNASSYSWKFQPIAGQTFTDTGSAACSK